MSRETSWATPFPDFPHWEPPKGRGPHDTPPAILCPAHRRAWLAWRDHYLKYRTDNPTEWPGGSHIMDSRTSHTTRRRGWIEKDAGQMELVERICLSGTSPECDRGWRSPYVGEGPDGCRRSAEIDRNEADTYDRGTAGWHRCLESAQAWEKQAEEMEAVEAAREQER